MTKYCERIKWSIICSDYAMKWALQIKYKFMLITGWVLICVIWYIRVDHYVQEWMAESNRGDHHYVYQRPSIPQARIEYKYQLVSAIIYVYNTIN